MFAINLAPMEHLYGPTGVASERCRGVVDLPAGDLRRVGNTMRTMLIAVTASLTFTGCGGGGAGSPSSGGLQTPIVQPPVQCPDGTTVPAGQSCPVQPPVQCPDGTTVPAGQSCPVQPTTGTIDWLFPGTVASEEAYTAVKKAIEDHYDPSLFRNYDKAYGHGITFPTVLGEIDESTGEYSPREGYAGSWGYWNHPSIPDQITLVQEVLKDDPDHPSAERYYKRVIGLMDNGYFGIMYSDAQDFEGESLYYQSQEENRGEVAFHAFANWNAELNRILNLDGRWRDLTQTKRIDLEGATYSGSALGTRVASQTPVFGPATFTYDGISPPRHERDRSGQARFLLRVDWDNGDSIEESAEIHVYRKGVTPVYIEGRNPIYTEGITPVSYPSFVHRTPDSLAHGDKLGGSFAGENAEEVFGLFNTQGYQGAFGAKRK